MQVPEGWSANEIGDIATIFVGRDLLEEQYSEEKTSEHIYPIYSNTVENYGLYGYYNFPEYRIDAVTVVGRGIGLGTAFARHSDAPFGAIGRLLVVSPKNDSFDVDYFANYINFKLRIFNESGGIPQLPGASLAKYQVYLPPLKEQQKIAQILSTWDKAITTTEQLLTNSQQQKKALMQQLLTGKKRLLDENGQRFSGEWKKGLLKDIAKIAKGRALSSKDLIDGVYPVIAGGKTSPYSHHAFTHENIITVSASGAYAGYVSFHPCKIWASDCSVIDAKTGNEIEFVYFTLEQHQHLIYSLQSGGAQPHVYPKDLDSLKINMPPTRKEQQKIATVLTAADNEITQLQQKLDQLKQEKKALMQQLLTGKRRVKVEEVA